MTDLETVVYMKEIARENVLKFYTMHPDVMHFNSTRVINKSSLDGWSLSEAEIE